MSQDHESPAALPGEPVAQELLGRPALFPLAEVATRFDPGRLTYLRPMPTWVRSEMRLAVDPEGWALRSAAESAEYDIPPELHIGLQQQVPQALLRDLVKRGGFNELEAAKNLLANQLKIAGQTQVGR